MADEKFTDPEAIHFYLDTLPRREDDLPTTRIGAVPELSFRDQRMPELLHQFNLSTNNYAVSYDRVPAPMPPSLYHMRPTSSPPEELRDLPGVFTYSSDSDLSPEEQRRLVFGSEDIHVATAVVLLNQHRKQKDG